MNDFLTNLEETDDLNEFLHYVVDNLIEKNTIFNNFPQKVKQIICNANMTDVEQTVKQIEILYKQFCLGALDENEIKTSFSYLSTEAQSTLITVINVRQNEVLDYLCNQINAKETKLLNSFDWNLKWIMGSSNLATTRKQLITLIFNCHKVDSNIKGNIETVFFETNENKLDELINILEECNEILNK